MASSSPILKAAGLKKVFYGEKKISILNGVDLTVYPGDTIAIRGRSGQGKTTLLHLLGLLDTPCSGTVKIAGKNSSFWNKSLLRRDHIGFVFQAFHLLDDLSVMENILMPLRIARENVAKNSPNHDRVLDLIARMGLKERYSSPVRLLSGGEKQRVALARAMITNPALILADEPSGNLDKETAQNIHQLLLEGAKERGAALVVVTHDEQLANLCSINYILQDGLLF